MEILFNDDFVKSLKKYAGLKKAIQKKVDMIIQNPLGLGEPLKGNLRGFYSCPVVKNFLIIYLYCRLCRRKNDHEIVRCGDCAECSDETLKFIELGPHDKTYQSAK